MITTTAFPVLLTLEVLPQNVYDLIKTGIECERLKLQTMECLNHDLEYYRTSTRILEGERVLRFMRDNAAPGEIMKNIY